MRMKKLLSVLAITSVLSAACFVMPVHAATTQPYVESDTTINFTLARGKTYAYKMTVHGTHANPQIVAGNGNVLRTESVKHTTSNGNDVYYFKIRAIGKQGQATGVYTTLPNQKSVRHSDVAIPYNAGVYKVGTDIPAGSYTLTAGDYSGYYEVKSKNTTGLDDVLFNQSFDAREYVTVSDGQYLALNDATMISTSNAGKLLPFNGYYKPSTFKVGFDIPAGTYNIKPVVDDYGTKYSVYMAVRNQENPTYDSELYSDDFGSTRQYTFKDGEYVQIENGLLSKA